MGLPPLSVKVLVGYSCRVLVRCKPLLHNMQFLMTSRFAWISWVESLFQRLLRHHCRKEDALQKGHTLRRDTYRFLRAVQQPSLQRLFFAPIF